MKNLILYTTLMLLSLLGYNINAQNPLSQKIQTEFGLGFATSFIHKGVELKRSEGLRNAGLSYYQNTQGERQNVGKYDQPIGWVITTAYFRPITIIKGLMLGTALRASLTGSEPKSGGYQEAYFFNFINVTAAAKYYPFVKNNFFVKSEFGMASVLTKNRFLNSEGEQNYFHQFGVGTNISACLGYSFKPSKNNDRTFDIQAVYQLNTTRVEVDDVGNDQWQFSGLNLIASINF